MDFTCAQGGVGCWRKLSGSKTKVFPNAPSCCARDRRRAVAASMTNSCLRNSRLRALFAQTKTIVPGMSQFADTEFGILQNGTFGNLMCLPEHPGEVTKIQTRGKHGEVTENAGGIRLVGSRRISLERLTDGALDWIGLLGRRSEM